MLICCRSQGSSLRRPWFFCCNRQRSRCGLNRCEIGEQGGFYLVVRGWTRGFSQARGFEIDTTERKRTPAERKVALWGLPSNLVLIAALQWRREFWKVVTWLILPVVICLSQRLSHACLSINKFVLWNCEWLIKSVIVYLMLHCYMDNCGNSRANTCNQAPTSGRGVFIR